MTFLQNAQVLTCRVDTYAKDFRQVGEVGQISCLRGRQSQETAKGLGVFNIVQIRCIAEDVQFNRCMILSPVDFRENILGVSICKSVTRGKGIRGWRVLKGAVHGRKG